MLNEDVTIVDGGLRHAQHPDTFQIPSYEEIGRLHRGDLVKIALEAPRVMGERFWVTLTDIQDRSFKGRVANMLFHRYRWGIDYGDEVEFEARHIIAIEATQEVKTLTAA